MSFEEEEEDEDEYSSSSSQLNSNTRPSSATSKKSIRVSREGWMAVCRAGHSPRLQGKWCGEMMVSGSLGWAQMPTYGELLRPGLSRPPPPNQVSLPGQEGGETAVGQDDLRTYPQGWLREGRAGKLADDPRARLAGLHLGLCLISHHHHIKGQLWTPDLQFQLLGSHLPCRRQPQLSAQQPQSPRQKLRSKISRNLHRGQLPRASPSSAASRGTRRGWTGGCTPPTFCTWTERTGRR